MTSHLYCSDITLYYYNYLLCAA